MMLPKTSLPLKESALLVLAYRYLIKDESGKVKESPEEMFWRVARTVAEAERFFSEDPELWAERFYELMTSLDFLPNSPTLMNAGLPLGQLSACFVLPVEDSLETIFETLKAAALIHKSGGGTGFSFSRIRPKGDVVRSTQGIASGPVSFMRVFNAATEAIKQGGKRRGANMGVLRIDHPDIEEFIQAKNDPRELTNFNLSVAITDAFMEALRKDDRFPIINPRTRKEVRRVKARKLFDLLVESAWRTGDPGVIFIDTINRSHPTPLLGEIESTNPCVPKDTWVMTAEGPRQVQDLLHRPFKVRLNGTDHLSPEGFFSTGKRPVLEIRTKEGFRLKATENHPLLRVSRLTRHSIQTEWVPVRDLRPGDRLLVNALLNLSSWPGYGSFEEGYLLGLLLGDGTLKKDKAVLSVWAIGINGIQGILNQALQAIRTLPHRKDFRGWQFLAERRAYRLASAALRDLAYSLGLKPGHKKITPFMERASSEFYRGFLRGLFDADGSVQGHKEKGASIRLVQSDLGLLQVAQRMLLRLGILAKIYAYRRKEGPRFLPDGRGGKALYFTKANHELVISGENLKRFEEAIGFAHQGKARRLKELLARYQCALDRERFVVEVTEIVPAGEEEVFDCRVPRVNAFDANGFIVHNCGEQPLLPYESCNLGSINLSRFVKDGKVDYERLQKTVHLAVRFLDDVIEVNRFPLPHITRMTRLTRKIGLGVMGFADLLIKLGIPYHSERAVKIAEEIMAFVERESVAESQRLAETRGRFPAFVGSVWDRRGFPAMRNATTTTVAPTGTLSIIAGTSSGIEPLFALAYRRRALDGGEWTEIHEGFLETLKKHGLPVEDILSEILEKGSLKDLPGLPPELKGVFVTAFEIPPKRHLAIQDAFQRHTHNAVSKTINLPEEASQEEVARIYLLAYEMGLKGVTVYRYGSRPEAPIKFPKDKPCPVCGDPLEHQEYGLLCHREGYSDECG